MRTTLTSLLAIGVLLIGVIAYSRVYRSHNNQLQESLKMGFTIEYTLTQNGQVIAKSIRYVESNGEFLEDTNYLNPDGSSIRHSKLAGTLNNGAVRINDSEKKLSYLGNAALITPITEARLLADKNFNRKDSLLGYKVIVARRCAADNQRCTEYWQAPDLGGEILKMDDVVSVDNRNTKEATSIRLGEPTFEVPDYSLDNTKYQELQQIRRGASNSISK